MLTNVIQKSIKGIFNEFSGVELGGVGHWFAWQSTHPTGGWWLQYVDILYIEINFTTLFFGRCF